MLKSKKTPLHLGHSGGKGKIPSHPPTIKERLAQHPQRVPTKPGILPGVGRRVLLHLVQGKGASPELALYKLPIPSGPWGMSQSHHVDPLCFCSSICASLSPPTLKEIVSFPQQDRQCPHSLKVWCSHFVEQPKDLQREKSVSLHISNFRSFIL